MGDDPDIRLISVPVKFGGPDGFDSYIPYQSITLLNSWS